VAEENDPTMQMQQMLRAMGQDAGLADIKPILEVNLTQPIVVKLSEKKQA
jgi:molecular chaperone HtpG